MAGIGGVSSWVVPGFAEERELGRGASGRVVAAVQVSSGYRVAIKYLSPAYLYDPEFLSRFRAEAALLRSLADPHVVRIFDYVEAPGQGAAIVMELVSGTSLHAMITRQGPAAPESALAVLKGSLLGLAAAHALGIVHRDYKPENVLVDGQGTSKLTDFGMAARTGGSASFGGTPLYMAPEQWDGSPPTPATDIYAATAVFFECLTGATPFTGGLAQLQAAHAAAAVPVERVDEPLRAMIARGMAKDPAARPANASAFMTELEATAATAYGTEWESRGRGRLAAGATALMMLLYGAGGGTAATGAGVATTSTTTWFATVKGAIASHALLYTGLGAAIVGIVGGTMVGITRAAVHSPRGSATSTATPAASGTPATSRLVTAACGSSGQPPIAYVTSAPASSAGSVAVRCGTGTPRTLGTFQESFSQNLSWSPDGSQLGWVGASAVYVAQVSSGTWTVRQWPCQDCGGLAFQGKQAVTVSGQLASLSVTGAQPQLLVFPASGTAPPATLPVTGIPVQPNTAFTVLANVSPTDVVVSYATHFGAHGTGTSLLYRVGPSGQATQYGTGSLSQSQGPNVIYGQGILGFTANAAGSEFALYNTLSGGAACVSTTAQVLDTATGTVSTPAMPPGGGGLGWEVQGMWFDRTGTPVAALLPSRHGCIAPVRDSGIIPAHAAPIVCKLSGSAWVRTGTGVFNAAYGPGNWLAEVAGTTDQSGAGPRTLTISGGAGTTPATVQDATTFAWAPAATSLGTGPLVRSLSGHP